MRVAEGYRPRWVFVNLKFGNVFTSEMREEKVCTKIRLPDILAGAQHLTSRPVVFNRGYAETS
jgi:hypothetical protein